MTKVIKLTKTIHNPEKDGRSRDWHKQPIVPEGSRFIVDSMISKSGTQYQHCRLNGELGKLILDPAFSVEVEPETVQELVAVHHTYDAHHTLRALIKLGRVTADDFKAVGEAFEADEDF